MDLLARIESKIDALLKKQSIKWEEPQPQIAELTAAEKEAIANAPAVTPAQGAPAAPPEPPPATEAPPAAPAAVPVPTAPPPPPPPPTGSPPAGAAG